ncbi:energy-coupling factor transporter transmembrane protein EcfT, partial [Streptomyces anulatus]|nr:energy-coupling factor transporter transmembrane protein EcfT [Streptomyces anulatus]
WGVRAWLVAGSGAAVAAAMIWAGAVDPEAMRPGVVPLTAPVLPLWPAAAVLIGLLPALVAPVPPSAHGTGKPSVHGTGKQARIGKEQA